LCCAFHLGKPPLFAWTISRAAAQTSAPVVQKIVFFAKIFRWKIFSAASCVKCGMQIPQPVCGVKNIRRAHFDFCAAREKVFPLALALALALRLPAAAPYTFAKNHPGPPPWGPPSFSHKIFENRNASCAYCAFCISL
jgi:hypothetical protein